MIISYPILCVVCVTASAPGRGYYNRDTRKYVYMI